MKVDKIGSIPTNDRYYSCTLPKIDSQPHLQQLTDMLSIVKSIMNFHCTYS